MAECILQKRAATTGGRLKPIEKPNPRPKTHYPFITKIQVVKIIKNERDEGESKLENGKNPTNKSIRPTNFVYKAPPVTRSNSSESLYEEKTIFVPRRPRMSAEETRRERRKILGERASASHVRTENDSLYRPRISVKACDVQLMLVQELNGHLENVSRETRSARRIQRFPVFHSRATKGEREFGVSKWKY